MKIEINISKQLVKRLVRQYNNSWDGERIVSDEAKFIRSLFDFSIRDYDGEGLEIALHSMLDDCYKINGTKKQ